MMSDLFTIACDSIIESHPKNWAELAKAAATVDTRLGYKLAWAVTLDSADHWLAIKNCSEAKSSMQMAKLGAQLCAQLEGGQESFADQSMIGIQHKIVEAASVGKYLAHILSVMSGEKLSNPEAIQPYKEDLQNLIMKNLTNVTDVLRTRGIKYVDFEAVIQVVENEFAGPCPDHVRESAALLASEAKWAKHNL